MAKPIVALTRRWPAVCEDELARDFTLIRNPSDTPLSRDALAGALRDCDVLAPTVTDRIDAEMLDQADRRASMIGNFGVGFNNIDVAAAQRLGVRVSNTPGVLTDATADLAMLLILACARRAGEGERLVRAGRWPGWAPTQLLGTQVSGATLGVVGLGRIGTALARRAVLGFGMQLLYYNRSAKPELEAELGAQRLPLEALLARADFVSLHCPSNADTRHLIGAEALAQMPRHAYLINTARGDVVDEAALVQALADQRIAGAGLDVYEAEPAVHPGLLPLENAVLLPHLGSATESTRIAMGRMAAANIRAFFAGEPLPNPVC